MSIPEPELPKQDDSVVETPSPNSLGDLEAQNKALSEQLEKAQSQVARLETENQTLKQDYDNFLESSPVMIDHPLRVVAILQSRRREEREEREKLEAQLAEFKQNPASANQQLDTVAQKPTVVEQQLAEVGGDREKVERLQKQIEELTADRAAVSQQVEAQLSELKEELATLAADREELAQLKKQAAEAAAFVQRSGRSIELEKVSGQQQLSDARAELADAKATILKQGDKIRELERGYSFKPNPAESALRLEISELRSELAELKQNPTTASDLSDKAGEIVNFFRTLLPKDAKLPKNTMSKLREILEATED